MKVEPELNIDTNQSSPVDLALLTVGTSLPQPTEVKVQINAQLPIMEFDTGAKVSIIFKKIYSTTLCLLIVNHNLSVRVDEHSYWVSESTV